MMRQEQLSYDDAPTVDPALQSSRIPRIVNAHLLSAALLVVVLPISIFGARLSLLPQILLLLGVALSACLAAAGWQGGAMLSSPIDWRRFAGCAALSLGLCLVGWEYHLFFSPYDWFIRHRNRS
jgi:hypothetical protein